MSHRVLSILKEKDPRELSKEIGVLVRKMRKEQKLNQTQLATLAGVSQTFISKLETGIAKDLCYLSLTKVGCALGISISPWWLQR